MSELPKCPQCGLAPEFHWKDYRFGSCSGALRCPYNHHRVSVSYHSGQKDKARIALECAWVKEVKQETEK